MYERSLWSHRVGLRLESTTFMHAFYILSEISCRQHLRLSMIIHNVSIKNTSSVDEWWYNSNPAEHPTQYHVQLLLSQMGLVSILHRSTQDLDAGFGCAMNDPYLTRKKTWVTCAEMRCVKQQKLTRFTSVSLLSLLGTLRCIYLFMAKDFYVTLLKMAGMNVNETTPLLILHTKIDLAKT